MNTNLQLLIPVLLPVVFGLLIGFARPLQKGGVQRFVFISAIAVNTAVVLFIVLQENMSLELLRLTDRLPILFRTDGLTRLFCVLSCFMFLFVAVYCPKYMSHEGNESRFYMFYLLVFGSLLGFGFSGNLITLYLFFEMTTFLSIPLVLHSMEKEAVAAAFKYLYYSIAGASLAVIGFFFIFTYGTTIEFNYGGVLDMELLAGRENQMLVVTLLGIIGFGAKAGMFPLHAWLPVAHPVAPAPASALLSGVITKVGIFAIVRFVFHLVGPEFIRGTWVQYAWIGLALFTGIMGSLLAFREPALKRRLAYSTISQIGYILFGFAVLTHWGAAGAFLQMVFHSIGKNVLFLVAGAIILQTHKTQVADLSGIGKQMPAVIWCFALASLSLIGIPPTGGFTGKWFIATGSLVADTGFLTWLGPAVLLLSALLAAGYLMPVVISGFFPGGSKNNSEPGFTKLEAAPSMIVPIAVLAAALIILGVFPDQLIAMLEQIIAELL